MYVSLGKQPRDMIRVLVIRWGNDDSDTYVEVLLPACSKNLCTGNGITDFR
jgi:hypothetical protein